MGVEDPDFLDTGPDFFFVGVFMTEGGRDDDAEANPIALFCAFSRSFAAINNDIIESTPKHIMINEK